MSPTQHSLKLLRDDGWTAEVVEKKLPIPGVFVTRDLFGFADILAFREGDDVLLVQTTSAANVSARLKKIRASPEAEMWLRAGNRIQIHGWDGRDLRQIDVLPQGAVLDTGMVRRTRKGKKTNPGASQGLLDLPRRETPEPRGQG